MQIKGAIALVTGGAKGLGREIGKALAEGGAVVIVFDLDETALDGLPPNIESHCVDVTQPEAVSTAVEAIATAHGQIDILVNNAGVISSEPFANIMRPEGMMHSYESFRKSLAVNLDSVFIVTSAVTEQMLKKRTKGCIVNISSISAYGNEGQTAYSAAKAGVNAMTVTWAKELGRMGIRCNAVAPGFVDTPSTRASLTENVIGHIQTNTPLRCLGEPQDIALAVISVITNDFINGVVLDVNGGLTI